MSRSAATPVPGPPRYRAFVSYSHAADGTLAPALQAALQGFAKPWYRLRAMRVFRDKTSLAANPALWPAIERALADSQWFLLMAAPESARSPWVEQEVRWWLEHRSPDSMLVVLTDGELAWDATRSDFDWSRTTALGRSLSGKFASEPLYVDLRWAKGAERLSLRDTRFRAAVLDLAAPLHGRPKDDLDGEDVRQHRRTQRVAWSAGLALVVLTVAALGAATMAVHQARIAEARRQEAEREREIAVARQLAAQSEILRGQRTDLLPTSVLLAVESLRRAFSLEAVQSLQKGLQLLSAPGTLTVRHGANANDALLTSDGRRLVTASDDGTARVWDAATGAEIVRLEIGGRVMNLHLSRDGRRLATLTYAGKTVQVSDPASGRIALRLDHPAAVDVAAFSPDGAELATGARDGLVRIWDLASGRERLRLPHQNWVRALAYGADGKRIVSGSADRTTRMWDASDGAELWRIEHSDRVETVAYSADGRWVATGGWDMHARVLDAASGREVARTAHSRVVTRLAFGPDSRRLAVESDDGTARVIDLPGGAEVARFSPEGGVLDLAWSPDGRLLATGGLALAAQVWEIRSRREVARVALDAIPGSVAFGPRGETLVVAVRDGSARVVRLDDDALHHGEALRAAAFSPDGRFAAITRDGRATTLLDLQPAAPRQPPRRIVLAEDADELLLAPAARLLVTHNEALGVLRVWDPAAGATLWRFARPAGVRDAIHRPELSPDGRYLALGYSQARELAIVDAASGRVVGRVAHDDVIMDRRFSHDGRLLVTTGDRSVRIWESSGGAQRHRFELGDIALAASFSPDGARVAAAGADGIARVWDTSSGRELRRLDHGEGVYALAFSPDGSVLATSTAEAVRLWRVDSGDDLGVLRHGGLSEYLAFSPGGKQLASGSRDHSARVWDLARRSEVARMTDQGEAFRVVFDASGRWLLVEHNDAASRFWRAWLWRPEDLVAEACARVERNLGPEDRLRYLGNAAAPPTCPDLRADAGAPRR
jgi:WD40 repeat protein